MRALCMAIVLFLVTFAGSALAAPLEVRAQSGGLPLELVAKDGNLSGKLVVENRGSTPVRAEISLRDGSNIDPRLPIGLRVKFSGADRAVMLKPGEQREAEIEWAAPRGRRLHPVYGHVLVTAEGQESRPVAAGFHSGFATGEAGPSGRVLTFSLLAPLLAALILLAFRGREPRPGAGRWVWLAGSGVQLALLAWGVSRFDVFHTRFAGGDGLQLVERMPLVRGLGIEWFVGVDGASLVLALAASLLTLLSALLADPKRATAFGGLALLANVGLVGALVSIDLALLAVFWLLTLLAAVRLLSVWGGDPRITRGAGLSLGLGYVLVAFAIWQLSGTATPAYLIDGSSAPRVFSLIELSHGGFVPRTASLFGVSSTKLVYTCLFLGSAITLGVPPFGGWLTAALARVPTSVGLLLAGGVGLLGVHALWRVGIAALPHGTAWAAPAVAIFGVIATLYAALVALATDDPRRFGAHSLAASAGAFLVGYASLTAIGMQGALMLAVSRGFVVALLFGVLSLARADDQSSRLGPIARGAPLLAALGAVAWVAAAAGPGTLSFLGVASSVIGGLPTLRLPALAEVFALAVLAAASVRNYRRTFLLPDDGAPASALPAPTPERELSVVLTAGIVLVALGFWPRPLLRLIDASCIDQAELVNPPGALEVVQVENADELRLSAAAPLSPSLRTPL